MIFAPQLIRDFGDQVYEKDNLDKKGFIYHSQLDARRAYREGKIRGCDIEPFRKAILKHARNRWHALNNLRQICVFI